jgi:hypothetical protein
MKRFMIVLLALLIMSLTSIAQDTTPIAPPVGYMDSCNADPALLDYFGPNCLNPVQWDLPGFQRIGTWVFFTRPDGTTDGGVIIGFQWQFQEGRYHYYLMTQMPNPDARFGGRFEHIPPERLMS